MKRKALFLWLAVCLFGSTLVGCAPLGHTGASAPMSEDGWVFEGSAPDAPGSHGRLVLEKNFQQSQRLRWESADTRIGSAQVDFFQPRDWEIEGDPPVMLTFRDRSPGPVLGGKVWFEPYNSAEVFVVLGKDRIRYTLRRVERAGSR